MDTLSWLFKMVDGITGPAKSATSSLSKLKGQLMATEKAQDQLGKLGANMREMGKSGAPMRKGLEALDASMRKALQPAMLQRQQKQLVNLREWMKQAGQPKAARQVEKFRGAMMDHGRATNFASRGLAQLRMNYVGAGGGAKGMLAVMQPLGGALKSVGGGAMMAATAAAGALAGGASLAMGAGSYVMDILSFKEDSMFALTTILKSEEGAKRLTDDILKMSKDIGGGPKQALESITAMLGRGLDKNTSFALFQGLKDLETISPKANLEGVLGQILQMQSIKFLQWEDLKIMSENGLDSGIVLENLGKIMGKTAEQARELMAAGKIDSVTGMEAILESISQATGGGPLGSLSKKRSEGTMGGLLDKIKHAPETLMLMLDTTEAGAGIKRVLRMITSLLDPASRTGQMISKAIGAGLGKIADLMAKIDPGKMQQMFVAVMHLVTAVTTLTGAFTGGFMAGMMTVLQPMMDLMIQTQGAGSAVNFLASGMRIIGAILGGIFGAFLMGVIAVTSFGAAVYGLVAKVPEWVGSLYSIGSNFVTSIKDGIVGQWDSLVAELEALAQKLPAPIRKALGMHSPSKVMMELGAYTTEGFMLGLQKYDPSMAMRNMVRVPRLPSPEASFGLSRAMTGTGGVTIGDVIVHVDGGGDPDKVGAAVSRHLLSALTGAFSNIATEGGA